MEDSYTDIILQNVPAHKMHLSHALGVDLAKKMQSAGADKIISAAKIANKPENNPQQVIFVTDFSFLLCNFRPHSVRFLWQQKRRKLSRRQCLANTRCA